MARTLHLEIETASRSRNSVHGRCRVAGQLAFFKYMPAANCRNEWRVARDLQAVLPSPAPIRTVMSARARFGLNLYQYSESLDSGKALAHSELCRTDVSKDFQRQRVLRFWRRYGEHAVRLAVRRRMAAGSSPSRVLFATRLWGGRMRRYYGQQYEALFRDLRQRTGSRDAALLETRVPDLLRRYRAAHWTWCTLTHGDLHDQNYGFEPIFIDLTTAGLNPFTADVACYYWYCHAEAEYLLPRYDAMSRESRVRVLPAASTRELALACYRNEVIQPFVERARATEPTWDWRGELAVALFARMFGVLNVLEFAHGDRVRLYKSLSRMVAWREQSGPTIELPFDDEEGPWRLGTR